MTHVGKNFPRETGYRHCTCKVIQRLKHKPFYGLCNPKKEPVLEKTGPSTGGKSGRNNRSGNSLQSFNCNSR